ncbi:nitrogen regulation protein NR(II) [Sterolibacterium denitrificans]|uniref:nitrogen regulation protein NR(II) n=1 Tax=Sterolibacterium denitrificans TaxID=157592 RepID=UPI001E46E991|nr:nitrogen regulation protein NR(II) [Sterolibacterium denitrificans]
MSVAHLQHGIAGRGEVGSFLLEYLTTAVVLLDDRLRVCYANPAAEQLLATSVVHLIGQPMGPFFEAGDWDPADLRDAQVGQHAYTRREARLCPPGSDHVVRVDYTITPLGDAGRVNCATQLLMELQPLDRLLRISREGSLFAANQATRALVRGVAHEVKNPLGGIRGAVQLLARELNDPGLQEYIDVIISETDRLRNLVDRMLGPRKLPDFRRINIHQVLERVRMIQQAELGDALVIERDYDPSLPELWGDLDQLIQVVLNILRNAVQSLMDPAAAEARSGQDRPRIVMRSRVLRQLTIGAQCHRLVCLVEVEDNGPGIGEELRETLFYPMVTGRSQGTGLGLPIAQSIIQQHGGLIECDSRPGRTVFRILIPFEPAESIESVASAESIESAKPVVLVEPAAGALKHAAI